jgi:prepilin-type processing-associated H-X9-DG protein
MPATQVTASELSLQGGHCSYVYLGKGLSPATVPATRVIAYEPLGHHGDATNFLYGDGHVEFVRGPKARKIIAELEAGQNPPRAEKIR